MTPGGRQRDPGIDPININVYRTPDRKLFHEEAKSYARWKGWSFSLLVWNALDHYLTAYPLETPVAVRQRPLSVIPDSELQVARRRDGLHTPVVPERTCCWIPCDALAVFTIHPEGTYHPDTLTDVCLAHLGVMSDISYEDGSVLILSRV